MAQSSHPETQVKKVQNHSNIFVVSWGFTMGDPTFNYKILVAGVHL